MTVGSELDRASRRKPALAGIVPHPFRNFAQERLTLAQVRSIEPAKALDSARLLVARSPIPAEHLTLLAIAEERQGNRDASVQLIQEAAQRGWRDPIAQQAMFDIALAADDVVQASQRFAALYATHEDQAPLLEMRDRLLATARGREAFGHTLAEGGRWTTAFLRNSLRDLAPTTVQSIILAKKRGAVLDCAIMRQIHAALSKQNREAEASAFTDCAPR